MDEAPELNPSNYGFKEEELDIPIKLEGMSTMHGFLNPDNNYTVRQLLDRLRKVYCGTIGYEYMHITNRAQCNWIRDRIETSADAPLTIEEKKQLLDRMCYAEVGQPAFARRHCCTAFGVAVAEPTALLADPGDVRSKQVDNHEAVWSRGL